MLDFFKISTRATKRGIEVYPSFTLCKSTDLMIRGGDFYAIWVEERGLWSTDEQDAIFLIDNEIRAAAQEKGAWPMLMEDAESGVIDSWHRYCQKQMRDSFHMLDEKLIFSNTPTNKKDYASKRLNYPLEDGKIDAYDKLMSTLYSPAEREKIEWAIGSIVSGASKHIQKFLVLYGAAGTGKSTVLNIVQQLFEGYYSVFDAKALGSSSNVFALEAFKSNPLVALQHDGDLSHIEDNTRLNSLVSHELMTVNEKFKSTYANRFKCFLFIGTNKPVRITDAKSGLIRRLIDVSPSGNKLPQNEYQQAMRQIRFELGAIASHCQTVYLADPCKYDDYIPVAMLGASNDFYNFVMDSYPIFKKEDSVTLKAAWEMYNAYCEEARVNYPLSQRAFKEELKNYFRDYNDRFSLGDGLRVRSYYSGFRTEKFEDRVLADISRSPPLLIEFREQPSILDAVCCDCPAQYATTKETPAKKWDDVRTTLTNIDTHRLHYIKLPEEYIVIDFDIPDKDGNKSLERNIQEASKWPATYAELSKSGQGIHLHYIYTGDPSKLSRVYDDHVEVKVFTGKSSLRRMLTKCNDHEIATINSGLPLKGEKRMINFEGVKSEKGLRTKIKRNLNKEYHGSTKPSVDFIYKDLVDAYNSGLKYDVTDMRNDILVFAANSTHQADYCIKLVNKMPFKSEAPSDNVKNDEAPLVFYDVEVFPNLFLVNWKVEGSDKPVVRMINPEPSEIEDLLQYRLVGFNCRRYDNHILYARYIGYTNEQLYELSQKIINNSPNCYFGEAYNVSYTDVYDFSTKKQSLKKWEIELGIHHQELGLPWDQPVPEELWVTVAEYCDNDVIATEAVFNSRKGDFIARQIQVELVRQLHGITNISVNDTTNALSGKIIFGKEKKPQSVFNYRDLSQPVPYTEYEHYREIFGTDYVFRIFDRDGLPVYKTYDGSEALPEGYSILPFFPRYIFNCGRSIWLDDDQLAEIARTDKEKAFRFAVEDKTNLAYQEIGEGGRVFARPNMYGNVWDGDISSQHPHSAIAEVLFGPVFTKRFEEIVEARVDIKHRDFESAGKRLNGALKPYLTEELAEGLAQALKIVINSIYGLTSASFDNLFRDIRNKDNIVAKRGALFMTLLKSEVEKRGFTVAHIKTDSIKIPDATQDIQDFVIRFGKEFGYTFETEANFEKFCLVNNAVYIAKYKDGKHAGEWTATGAQFAVPYVFKKLFSKENITFADMCETKAVTSALYLDMNEDLPDVSALEAERDRLAKKAPGMAKEGLDDEIAKGHDYRFVGKVGQFCPIKPGCGGGLLLRETENKKTGQKGYSAATGTIGYRWLESEMVRTLGREADIDRSYYDKMVDAAIETISEYGDFEQFVSNDPYISDNTPPWFGADEPHEDGVNLFAVR